MKRFKTQVLLTVGVLCAAGTSQANWITLDFPGATYTEAYGIDGLNIVGSCEDTSGTYGFIYTISEPGTVFCFLGFVGLDC